MSRTIPLALALLALSPRMALAQDAKNLPVAQALYAQAVKEMAAKSYATACPKLEEAVRLVPEGVGGKLTLAECYEASGKLASAWSTYALAEATAARAGQADRQKLAHDRAAKLEPKLAMLTIVVEAPARDVPGLEIKRDGVVVGAAQWGVPLPVDKGRHVITATVGDGRTWERAVDVGRDGARETVGIGELPGAPKPQEPLPLVDVQPALAPAAPPPPPAPAPSAPPSSSRRVAGLVIGGVGVAGLAVGGALGVTAIVQKNQSNAGGHCNEKNRCDAEGTDLRNASLRAGNWSTAMFIGGAAALAGGVVLFATAPSASTAPRTTGARSISVSLAPHGAAVSGSF